MNKKEVQKLERRSIPIHDEPQSLPVNIDKSVFKQDKETKDFLKKNRSKFVSINKQP